METSIPPIRKVCPSCQQEKDLSDFRPACKRCKACTRLMDWKQCRLCECKVRRKDAINGAHGTKGGYYYCLPCWNELTTNRRKKCIRCHELKSLDEFAQDKSRTDGYEYYCKVCREQMYQQKQAKAILKRGTKQCLSCKKIKDLSQFSDNHRTRDGLDTSCIDCCNGATQTKQQERDKTREHKVPTMNRRKAARLKYLYRITESEYRLMLEQQNGVCAICGRPEIKKSYHLLGVDHDHATGRVRGLLCSTCNAGLGQFEDNLDYLLKAVEYLQQTS